MANSIKHPLQWVHKLMLSVSQSHAALLIGGVLFLYPALGKSQTISPTKPERLSKIIESSTYTADKALGENALSGLMLKSPAEIDAQKLQQEKLILQIRQMKERNQSFSQKMTNLSKLERLITDLTPTGRMLLPNQDPRWLEAHPPLDPIVTPKDTITLPTKSRFVTVIRDDGRVCQVPFRSNVFAQHYTTLCDIKDDANSSWAWLVQADGHVQKVGLAHWNASTQDQPNPGSWIWAPSSPQLLQQTLEALPWSRTKHFTDTFSSDFANYLATQGPSDALHLSPIIQPDRSIMDSPSMLVQSQQYRPQEHVFLSSDWGSIGLLQTPSSRMLPVGSGLVNYTHVTPYSNYNFLLQPFDILETTFRYTTDTNQAYGSQDFSGNQSYLDKSVDFKLRLVEENTLLPQVAIGIRDVTGTGLFSGEYVVGNKRYGNFDFSFGLAWGYMGNRGNIKNPLSILGSGFNARPSPDVGQGGNFSLSTYFHGPTALIGGVQYQTPIPNLSLKVELDGNNYQREPFGYNLNQSLPINFGAVYHWKNAHLSVGLERGNTAMIALTFHGNLSKLAYPKPLEAPLIPTNYKPISAPAGSFNIDPLQESISSVKVASLTSPNGEKTPLTPTIVSQNVLPLNPANMDVMGRDIATQSGWRLHKIVQQNSSWIVTLDAVTGVYMKDRINRVVSVLHRDAPETINTFVIQYQNHQLKLIQQSVNRQAWMLKQQQLLPPTYAKLSQPVVSEYVNNDVLNTSLPSTKHTAQVQEITPPSTYTLPEPKRLTGGVGIGFQQNVGGPDGYLFALSAVARSDLKLWDGAWISGALNLRALDNYDHFTYDAPSNLPRVRTYIREYLTSNRVTMPNLQLTQMAKWHDNHYFSAYGGMLEMMFGGVGAEWLYRPLNSPFAIGVDLNQVKQRDFDQRFTFMDYEVFTGHITSYWETGWHDVLVKASVGQYLAGDRGYTMDLSRSFPNGVRMGAYFTKTNVSAEDFGEGSFDKGIYVSIPFDSFFAKHTASSANLLWSPLIRDGGAKLNRAYPLYNFTRMRDRVAMDFGPPVSR